MKPFETLTSVVAPLLRDNIDTDTIIPSREMTTTGRTGLSAGLFAPWRYVEGRRADADFPLNRREFLGAQILAAGANFGCGSSREHAVWALCEFGIRAIVAESFAPIFKANAVRNGLLPVILRKAEVVVLAGLCATIDLENQIIVAGTHSIAFEFDEEAKTMLLGGLDAIDATLVHGEAIAAFHARDRAARPWVYLGDTA